MQELNLMKSLQELIGEMAEFLIFFPCEELRLLEESLHRLTPEQVNFVHTTLDSAHFDERLATERLAFLKHFFESWWAHGLATKLVVIDRVIELSNDGHWPGGVPLHHAAEECIGNCYVDAVA